MTRYKTSQGEYVSKDYIDRKIRETKKKVLDAQLDFNGFNFCETCHKSSGVRLTCAHIKSVNDCQRDGESEKAFDINNIIIECMFCHSIRDKNNVQWK